MEERMMINWYVVLATAAYVGVEGWVSWEEEGYLTKLPFWKHSGNWADLFLLSVVNGLIWNYCWQYLTASPKVLLTIIPISLIATIVAHWFWFCSQNITSWVWLDPTEGFLWGMSVSGRLHVVLMTAELTLLITYALFLSGVPNSTIWAVAILLTVFCPLAILGPCRAITGKWIDYQGGITLIGALGLIWGISLTKLVR